MVKGPDGPGVGGRVSETGVRVGGGDILDGGSLGVSQHCIMIGISD
jgi:hypothetical protein